jgi:hypothetical protein
LVDSRLKVARLPHPPHSLSDDAECKLITANLANISGAGRAPVRVEMSTFITRAILDV